MKRMATFKVMLLIMLFSIDLIPAAGRKLTLVTQNTKPISKLVREKMREKNSIDFSFRFIRTPYDLVSRSATTPLSDE